MNGDDPGSSPCQAPVADFKKDALTHSLFPSTWSSLHKGCNISIFTS